LLTSLAGCATTHQSVELFGTARVVQDFDSYTLSRVGLIPIAGERTTREQEAELQSTFYSELSRSTNFEIVSLAVDDLAEVPSSDPVRRGWYNTRTILEISERFKLDGLLIGTITDLQTFHPQRISVQFDLVSAETGLTLWSSSLHMDAGDQRVREGLEAFYSHGEGDSAESGEPWELSLISPRRFARFAAWQIARLL
jgi:hypothetical protein